MTPGSQSPGPASRLGRALAKMLGIKLEQEEPIHEDLQISGEQDVFAEELPTTAQFLHELAPTGEDVLDYLQSLFPFVSWMGHYNLQWFLGDLVAGVTIGAIVVPQGMAYAKLAGLDVQFGLYSSFVGVLLYWILGTSKDVSIGPVAVLSTVTGRVVVNLSADYPDVPAHVIASGLGILAGAVILFLGLARLGWIVDLIPLVSLSAFVTGSALTIGVGQIAPMLGITGVSRHNAPYHVFINTLKSLPGAHRPDAAVGLSALCLLYLIRFSCGAIARRYPQKQRLVFFLSTLRTVFVILLYTLISWLVNRSHPQAPRFAILMTVPGGFQAAEVPAISASLAGRYLPYIPVAVVVLLIEHIAIAKSFGRVNGYTINPSQEMVAIGITNVLGAFLGAYPSTGSFSRTAVQSKAGSRTPAAGIVTAMVVLLAIYALPPLFYYIPYASLAAVIIHAIGDLILPPNTVYQFWRIAPYEVVIFFIGVIVTVFTSIEDGIYATVCISVATLLIRSLRARGTFLGRVPVHSVLDNHVIGDDDWHPSTPLMSSFHDMSKTATSSTHDLTRAIPSSSKSGPSPARNVFLPISHRHNVSNPGISVGNPYPGIFIYRFSEGFSFPSAAHTTEHLVSRIFAETRRTNEETYARKGDRPWNEPGPKKGVAAGRADLPTLKAVILDFSAVDHIDVTSVQQLVDVRNQLNRYAAPDPVDWHFAYIRNPWVKRALAAAGFGHPARRPGVDGVGRRRWKDILTVAEIGGSVGGVDMESGAGVAAAQERREGKEPVTVVEEIQGKEQGTGPEVAYVEMRRVAVHGRDRPLFHVDLTSALESAIANVEVY